MEYLIAHDNSFTEAKKKAQAEILAIFGFNLTGMDESEALDISKVSEGNAVLLAISIILQGNRSVGDLTELMAGITNDIGTDGIVNTELIINNLRNSTKELDLSQIRLNLVNRYKNLGISITIPPFEEYINTFLEFTAEKPSTASQSVTDLTTTSATFNGVVNANSLSTTVIFQFGKTIFNDSIPAMQNPLTGSSPVNVTAIKSGLMPGTTYHWRIKTKNSLGTTFSNDMEFNTMGLPPAATTLAATGIQLYSSTINSYVNPNLLSTEVTFEWGPTVSYGSTLTSTQSPVTGNDNTAASATLTGLLPGTTYHFRVKAVNLLGATYGNDLSFTTSGQVPSVIGFAPTDLAVDSATVNGSVNPNHLSTTVSFEWGTTMSYGSSVQAVQSPVTGNVPVSVSADLTGLLPGTIYHYRIKAENLLGISYSSDLTLTTPGSAPTAVTQPASVVQSNSAIITGTVNPNYLSSDVTFEWGTTTGYGTSATFAQSPVTGITQISVSATLSGLISGTLYHYRIKAVNEIGTTVGSDLTFTTTTPLTDSESNNYKTVAIGSQVWMAENLKTTKYSNGDLIGTTLSDISLETTPKYQWAYDNNESNVALYGRLYTWYAVADVRNICPAGWHVPSDAEWTTLTDYLAVNGFGYQGSGTDIAKSLAAKSGWTTSLTAGSIGNNQSENNSSGFTALPGGYRFGNGWFENVGAGNWWSATEYGGIPTSWWRSLHYMSTDVGRANFGKVYGMSVRCVKN